MDTVCTVLSVFCGILLFLLTGAILLMLRCGVFRRIFNKIVGRNTVTDWTLFSWQSSLEKMHTTVDCVFFGDSIVRGGDFQKAFPQKRILNLGISGNTLKALKGRVAMLQAVNPQKVFLLAGINGLKNKNVMLTYKEYESLLSAIRQTVPGAEIYVHSLLPVSRDVAKKRANNSAIQALNALLRVGAETGTYTFVDLYPDYVLDGELNPAYSVDGIHIKEEAYQHWYRQLEPYLQ